MPIKFILVNLESCRRITQNMECSLETAKVTLELATMILELVHCSMEVLL